ncbi:HAMP domain-containing sensor histidine kinase [Nonomuraea sp. NPDC005650]|uniref:HAMP domain-containing sensor histidine kinase n=1 Tax=Nonomuraea sp. NPDC005650 TaxID=3157045 RepID=UPI0033A4C2F1
MVVAALTLVAFALVGLVADLLIRDQVEARVFMEGKRVAAEWAATTRLGSKLLPTPVGSVNLLQLVNERGHVVAASKAAEARPRLSTVWPSSDDPFQYHIDCAAGDPCLMLVAMRLGQNHVVYAARESPATLSRHNLEFVLLGVALLATAMAAWSTWTVVGRTLRPVTVIRSQMAQLTTSELSLRVPQPSGHDEIAQLARTFNETLERLENAMERRRHHTSVIAHELKTPVAGLRAQLEEALLYSDVDPRTTIHTALSTTERLHSLIDELLEYSRMHTAEFEPVDLTTLIGKEVKARVGDPPIRGHVAAGLTVLGNPTHLVSVVNNLLVNAQRHARTGVQITAEGLDGQVVVTVTDDGDGIAPKDRERIFDPFVRLPDGRRRDPKGSGLGLAISRAIAVGHQGTLRVEDSERGSRFVLKLPLLTGDQDRNGDQTSGAERVADDERQPAMTPDSIQQPSTTA